MEKHSEIGERILSKVEAYEDVALIVRHHHERIDGEGYPDKLPGDEIPSLSRAHRGCRRLQRHDLESPVPRAMEYAVRAIGSLQAMGSQF